MSKSINLPNDDQVFQVYKYSCWTYDKDFVEIRVLFLNEEKNRYDGADHSCSSLIRHDFAMKLYDMHCEDTSVIWAPLPVHEYLEKLQNNGFQYDKFHVGSSTKSVINFTVFNSSKHPQINPISFY